MLSARVKNLKPSPTLALAAKAKQLKAEGKDVISLSVGEPDWDTFESIKRAGILAIENGQTKYTPANGLPELRKAIAKQVNEDLGSDYSPDDVTVSAGGKFVLYAIMQALIDTGDEVLIPAPYWVSYPTMVELANGTPKIIKCTQETQFKLTPEALEKSIGPKTKMVVFNSPSNPTGCLYSKEELDGLAAVLKKHPKVIIVSDDIYNRLVFLPSGLSPHILQSEPSLRDRTIIVNGASKTYSMTGWRLGWALGPSEIIKAMTRLQSQSVSCAAPFTQLATKAAIEQGKNELESSLRELKERRDFVVEELGKIHDIELVVPEGAFYVFPNVSKFFKKSFAGKTISGSKDFAEALLDAKNVATVPGVEFGLEGHLRMSYALSKDRMGEAIQRLNSFIKELS